jgi:hypothetical protein
VENKEGRLGFLLSFQDDEEDDEDDDGNQSGERSFSLHLLLCAFRLLFFLVDSSLFSHNITVLSVSFMNGGSSPVVISFLLFRIGKILINS